MARISPPIGARPSIDTTIRLDVADDGPFTWTVDAKGKTQRLAGKWSLAEDRLTLAESGRGGALGPGGTIRLPSPRTVLARR
jgi:hypothetical protein